MPPENHPVHMGIAKADFIGQKYFFKKKMGTQLRRVVMFLPRDWHNEYSVLCYRSL
jgi:hypothetical protein